MFWHYTTGDRFKEIVELGAILPATANVPHHERPIVWVSSNNWFEPTARKLLQTAGRLKLLTMMGTYRHGCGLARIGMEESTVPHHWRELRKLSGMSAEVAKQLQATAKRQGSDPMEWRGTFEPVPRSKWAAVEIFDGGKWVSVPLEPLSKEALAVEGKNMRELVQALVSRQAA